MLFHDLRNLASWSTISCVQLTKDEMTHEACVGCLSTVCPQGMMIDRPLEDKPLGVGRLTVYSRIKVSSMIAGTQVTSNIPIAWFTNASITARHESYSLAVMRLSMHLWFTAFVGQSYERLDWKSQKIK